MPCPHIEYILFDLDSTLYSARYGLETEVGRRVNEYIAARLKLPMQEAWEMRRAAITGRGYGTTLEWLLAETDFSPAQAGDYFAYIHPEHEAAALHPDPELRALLASIPLPKAILTNSSREHAVRILKRLGAEEHFTSIFDIRFNELKGKPREDAFRRPLDALGLGPERCALVDDVARNIEGYRAFGGLGILYDEFDKHPGFPGPRIRCLEELSPHPDCLFSTV
jgi:putative hydrolase of the HAD superfamily